MESQWRSLYLSTSWGTEFSCLVFFVYYLLRITYLSYSLKIHQNPLLFYHICDPWAIIAISNLMNYGAYFDAFTLVMCPF